jgi:translation initiation factor 5
LNLKKQYNNQLTNDIKMSKYETQTRNRPDGLLNINPKQCADPFNRYTMPPIEFIHKGKGLNGALTMLPNINKISKALKINERYVLQFLQSDLGSKVDDTKEVPCIKGIYDQETLQKSLDRLINTFIVCPHTTCDDVGTSLKVIGKKKKTAIEISCSACGNRKKVVPTRTSETKLCAYIIKNPPEEKLLKIRTVEHVESVESVIVNNEEEDNDNDDNEDNEDNEDDDFSVDTSPEAVAKRAAKECVGMVAGIVACAEQELSQSERLDLYYKFVTETKPSIFSIITEATRLNCGNKAVLVLFEVFCIDNIDFYTNPCVVINAHVDLLGHFLEGNHKAQSNFLDRLEKLCYKEELVPKFLRILANLYEKDLIEEEVILKWNSRKSSGPISLTLRKNIVSFIEWLEEEDEEEEDSDEEDGNIVFDSKPVEEKKEEDETEDTSFIDDM